MFLSVLIVCTVILFVKVSDFLPDSICAVNTASDKNRLGASSLRGRAENHFYDAGGITSIITNGHEQLRRQCGADVPRGI